MADWQIADKLGLLRDVASSVSKLGVSLEKTGLRVQSGLNEIASALREIAVEVNKRADSPSKDDSPEDVTPGS